MESMKKELDHNAESYQRMKRNFEEQISNHLIREKVILNIFFERILTNNTNHNL